MQNGSKKNPTVYCLQETHLSSKDRYRLKVKEWRMLFQANGIQRKARVVVLISNEIHQNEKGKDSEGHFIMIKRIMHQENITLVNIYAPNQGAPKYVKQLLTELNGETDQNTMIIGELNTPLSDIEII